MKTLWRQNENVESDIWFQALIKLNQTKSLPDTNGFTLYIIFSTCFRRFPKKIEYEQTAQKKKKKASNYVFVLLDKHAVHWLIGRRKQQEKLHPVKKS